MRTREPCGVLTIDDPQWTDWTRMHEVEDETITSLDIEILSDLERK
jgi:hypothetical protein